MFALASWYRNRGKLRFGWSTLAHKLSHLQVIFTYKSFSPTSQLAYGSVYKLVACIQAFVIKERQVDRLFVFKFLSNGKILVRSHRPM